MFGISWWFKTRKMMIYWNLWLIEWLMDNDYKREYECEYRGLTTNSIDIIRE